MVAEIACAHEGDVDRALNLIADSARAGASAVQLQLFTAEGLVSPRSDAFELTERLALPTARWAELLDACRKAGAQAWATVFEPSSIELAAERGAHVLKVHSTDLANPTILDAAARTGLPLSIAVGGSTIDEMVRAIDRLSEQGAEEVIVLTGFQAFPTPPEELHLRHSTLLSRVLGRPWGYQDHTAGGDLLLGTALPVAAVALGARVVEKHVTDDRSALGIDHEAAFEPHELAELVRTLRGTLAGLGQRRAQPLTERQLAYRKRSKKHLYAASDLEPGHTLRLEDLVALRGPDGVMDAWELESLEGRQLCRPLLAHHPLHPADLDDRDST